MTDDTVLNQAELDDLVGKEIAVSPWRTITQTEIETFAAVTGDQQWIHIDEARAKHESPFGTTVAHGFFTLSLIARLMMDTITIADARLTLNYGLNRVRFITPVPAEARVRARFTLAQVEQIPNGVQVVWRISIELPDAPKPAASVEWVVRYMA